MTITYYNQLLTIIESNLHLISILKQELFLNHRPRAPQIDPITASGGKSLGRTAPERG